jgi:hypothetical protein
MSEQMSIDDASRPPRSWEIHYDVLPQDYVDFQLFYLRSTSRGRRWMAEIVGIAALTMTACIACDSVEALRRRDFLELVGIGAVVFIGWTLCIVAIPWAARWSIRRRSQSLADDTAIRGLIGRQTLFVSDAEIREEINSECNVVSWPQIEGVFRDARSIYLVRKKYRDAVVVPRRAFLTEEQFSQFFDFCRAASGG